MQDWLEILPTPLPTADAIRFVSVPEAGGVAVFLGTTRGENHPQSGHPLLALDYEAYPELANRQLTELAHHARQKWPILKLAVLHRTGRVGLAEPSVVIAVSTPHRAESFEACRYLIDQLKVEVAVWKKEVWSDGTTTWVDPTAAARPSSGF
jgi:molybdopterin synthase catalytic subunit